MPYTAKTTDGKTYEIGSEKGVSFVENAKAGETLTGGDGSTWTKNADGSVSISKNGKTYSVGGGTSASNTDTGNSAGQNTTKNTSGRNNTGAYQTTSVGNNNTQNTQTTQKSAEQTSATPASTAKYYGVSSTGKTYALGTDKAIDFAENAEAGATLTGSDGSTWTKNSDGSVTINQNGTEYRVAAVKTPEPAEEETNYITQEDWDAYQAEQASMISDALNSALAANQASVDLSVEEIEATLENGLSEYSQQAEEEYLRMLQNQANSRAASVYAGDLGGIGQKQYDSATAIYDANLLSIALERQAFINSCNQQIDNLKAQGRLQDAETLSEWAQTKLEMYNEDYKWYAEYGLSQQQLAQEQANTDREYNYNRAVEMLNSGMLTEDALEVLGVSAEDAEFYANYINQMARYSLAEAQAELDALTGGSSGNGGEDESSNEVVGQVYVTHENGGATLEDMYADGTMDTGNLRRGDSYTDEDSGITFRYWTYSNGTGEWITDSQYQTIKSNAAAAQERETTTTQETANNTSAANRWVQQAVNAGVTKGSNAGATYANLTSAIVSTQKQLDSADKYLQECTDKLKASIQSSDAAAQQQWRSAMNNAAALKNKYNSQLATLKSVQASWNSDYYSY